VSEKFRKFIYRFLFILDIPEELLDVLEINTDQLRFFVCDSLL